jgi:outer membrane lipoprotein carrier protein
MTGSGRGVHLQVRAAVLLGCALALPGLLAGQSPDAMDIVDRAVAAYQRVTTLRADFTQVVSDPMIGTNDTSRGEFMQQRPNRFSMRWREPAGDLILSDGEVLWVYLPSTTPGQAIRSGLSRMPGQTPDVIAPFLERPRERFTITWERAESVGGRQADVLRFVPLERNVPYRRALIWIDRSDNLPRRVELTEASGAVRRVTLERLRVNTSLPSGMFEFRPPAGVRVVDATR